MRADLPLRLTVLSLALAPAAAAVIFLGVTARDYASEGFLREALPLWPLGIYPVAIGYVVEIVFVVPSCGCFPLRGGFELLSLRYGALQQRGA